MPPAPSPTGMLRVTISVCVFIVLPWCYAISINPVGVWRVKGHLRKLHRGCVRKTKTIPRQIYNRPCCPRDCCITRGFADNDPERERLERNPHRARERDQRIADNRHPREQQRGRTVAAQQFRRVCCPCAITLRVFSLLYLMRPFRLSSLVESLRRAASQPVRRTRTEIISYCRHQHRREHFLFASH